jgi:hypothetical protein
VSPRLPPDEIFALRPLWSPKLSGSRALASIQKLKEITPESGRGSSANLEDRVEALRARLQASRENGWSWCDATNVPRREWALIKLYTLHLGATGSEQWLCPFNDLVAESVLGTDGSRWHPSRRRDVTNFFFVQFDRITCLAKLSEMLRSAWINAKGRITDPAARTWAGFADALFACDGPDRIAAHWQPGETIDDLANRFFVPQASVFRDQLFNSVLLRRLGQLPIFSEDHDLFGEVERSKTRSFRDGRLLGGRANEILIDRVLKEAGGQWKETWSRRVVPFACHPRTLDPAEKQRWWGWANPQQIDAAIRGLTGLNIREFIRLLEGSLRGTGNEHQFPRRRDFLLKIFDSNLIQDAKLVVHSDLFHQLDSATRRSLQPSQSKGGGQRTSFICLKCSDGIFLIEGTHSFSLRGFRGEGRFPINGFWNNPPKLYDGTIFRSDEARCDVYQRHTAGWEDSFLRKLRRDLHIDWHLK